MMIDSKAVRLPLVLTCVLAWLAGNAQADFGTGTITFDETSYTLYEWGNVSNTSTLTVADDQAIGLDQAFRVSTSGGDVYVRMGFDRTAANNFGGTVGSLDAGDIPIVLENTSRSASGITDNINYRYDKSGVDGPGSNDAIVEAGVGEEARWAYTSRQTTHLQANGANDYIITDAIEAGYETQAGEYFVRAAQENALGADTGYTRSATTDGSNTTANDDWESFIIEYSGADVTAATGEIWDIDVSTGSEGFTVTAYDSSDVSIGTASSPTALAESNANSLDARPWEWSFSGLASPISKIVFTKTDASATWPLAFNNFNPVSSVGYVAPEPSSLLAFGGIFSLAMLRRRHRRVRG
jgi:hypothetical protein